MYVRCRSCCWGFWLLNMIIVIIINILLEGISPLTGHTPYLNIELIKFATKKSRLLLSSWADRHGQF